MKRKELLASAPAVIFQKKETCGFTKKRQVYSRSYEMMKEPNELLPLRVVSIYRAEPLPNGTPAAGKAPVVPWPGW
jgi:hypothetical protein